MASSIPYSILSAEQRAQLPGPVGDGDAELDGVSWRGKWYNSEAEIRVPSPTGPVSYRMAVRFRSTGWHVYRVVDAPKSDPAHKPVSIAPFCGDEGRDDAMRYAVEWAYRAANPPAPPLLDARSEYMAGVRFALSALDDILFHVLREKKGALVDEIEARAQRLAPTSTQPRAPLVTRESEAARLVERLKKES